LRYSKTDGDRGLAGPIMRQDEVELRLILQSGPSNTADPEPVVLAAQYGTTTVMEILLDHGWKADTPDHQFHQTPLSWSCKAGRQDLASLLLLHGADPDHLDGSGHPALVWAARGTTAAHIECVRLLINAGADVNAGRNATALMIASQIGNIDMVNELIRVGANVNLQRPNGTALTHAIYGNRSTVVDVLVAHGARVFDKLTEEAKNRPDWIGFNAVEVAKKLKKNRIVEFLLKVTAIEQ
jgi:ankyrin repeat protein